MPIAEGTLTPAASNGTGVSNQLASLVPTFDPAVDDLLIYQQKVQLVKLQLGRRRS